MKKMFSILLAALICFTLICIVPVKADDITPALTYEINNFKNEMRTGSSFDFNFTTDVEYNDMTITMAYKTDDGNLYYLDYDSENKKFIVPEDFKYISDNFQFLYLRFYAVNFDKMVIEFHSPYSADSEELSGWVAEDNQVFSSLDYSFTLTDANIDTIAPSLDDLEIHQLSNEFSFKFTSDENKSGIGYLRLMTVSTDENENTYPFNEIQIPSYDIEKDGNVYTAKYILNPYIYLNYPYGNYEITEVCLEDKVGNITYISGEGLPTIELKKEDNIYENLEKDDIEFYTDYVNNDIYYRINSTLNSLEYCTSFLSNQGIGYVLTSGYVDLSNVDTSVVGSTTVPVNVSFVKNFDQEVENFTYSVNVHIVNVVGKVVEDEHIYEVSMTLEEYNRRFDPFYQKVLPKITVQLNDGTFKRETVTPALMYRNYSEGEDGDFMIKETVFARYNPMYTSSNETSNLNTRAFVGPVVAPSDIPGMIKVETIYHIINENGDLVDLKGNVVTPFAEREIIDDYKTLNESVNLSSLYGTLPTYTEVNAEEVDNLSDLNGEDYIAYDINLIADYENIQPVGTTDLVIDLPEELADGESYIAYHYDDEGNKEEVEVTVENGKAYIKAESFSTYAIVKKSTTTPGGNEGNAGGNAGNGGLAPGSGDNTNNNSGSNNNTTGSGTNNSSTNSNTTTSPNTGDSTNVAMLLALLLSSAYVLRRKRA